MKKSYVLTLILALIAIFVIPCTLDAKEHVSETSFTQQKRIVRGRVLGPDGEPLIGASVRVKGTNIGTITDIDGNFAIEVPLGYTELEISYIGYKTKTVKIPASLTQPLIIRMEEDIYQRVEGVDENSI